MGFSDTMGAFIAGVLLSETNYKTQVRSCLLFSTQMKCIQISKDLERHRIDP